MLIEMFQFKKIQIFTILCGLLPRIIISLVLLIETFYFHYLSFLYKVILLGIFILLEKYIFFSLTKIKENLMEEIKDIIYIQMEYKNVVEVTDMYPEILPQYYDEEEGEYIYSEMMFVPFKKFLNYQENQYLKNQKFIFYNAMPNDQGFSLYRKRNNIENDSSPLANKLVMNFSDSIIKKLDIILKIIIIDLAYNSINLIPLIKNIKNVLIIITLICWLYILIISLPNLYLDSFFESLQFSSYIEPFSMIKL